ncbi:MAG: hypothetical protein ABIF77_03420, partial [bacterium]
MVEVSVSKFRFDLNNILVVDKKRHKVFFSSSSQGSIQPSALKIKPVIRVDRADGKYSTVAKNRTIPQSLANIANHLVEMYNNAPVWA